MLWTLGSNFYGEQQAPHYADKQNPVSPRPFVIPARCAITPRPSVVSALDPAPPTPTAAITTAMTWPPPSWPMSLPLFLLRVLAVLLSLSFNVTEATAGPDHSPRLGHKVDTVIIWTTQGHVLAVPVYTPQVWLHATLMPRHGNSTQGALALPGHRKKTRLGHKVDTVIIWTTQGHVLAAPVYTPQVWLHATLMPRHGNKYTACTSTAGPQKEN